MQTRMSVSAFLLLAFCLSPLTHAAVIYSVDDGTSETGVGVISMNPTTFFFLNQFTLVAGGETITSVDIAYHEGTAGTPVDVYLWSDPNGDGNPTDAQVLASATSAIANPGTDIFNSTPIGPHTFTLGTSFFVGGRMTVSGPLFPIAGDTSPSAGQGWLATGANFNDLSGAITSTTVDVNNLMIRATGIAIIPEPSSIVLAGLGISFALIVRAQRSGRFL